MLTVSKSKGSFLTSMAKWAIGWIVVLAAVVWFLAGGLRNFGFRFDPFHRLEHKAAALQIKADTAQDAAAVGNAQEAAGIAALQAYDGAQARGRRADANHLENSRAILSSPGAGAALDPALARTLSDGLCKYAAYDEDPGCGGLQPVHRPAAAQGAGGAAPDGD